MHSKTVASGLLGHLNDDGSGLDHSAGTGMGLHTIRERAETLVR